MEKITDYDVIMDKADFYVNADSGYKVIKDVEGKLNSVRDIEQAIASYDNIVVEHGGAHHIYCDESEVPMYEGVMDAIVEKHGRRVIEDIHLMYR